MKLNKTYRLIFSLIAVVMLSGILSSCNVCDGGGVQHEAPVRNIYFNAKNLNNESVNIFGISAEGSDLDEVLINAIILAPPSDKGHLLYMPFGSKRDVFLYSIKRRTQHLVSDAIDARLINPLISTDASYILSYCDKDKLLIIANTDDSVFKVRNEIPTKYRNTNHSIAPNSLHFAYFDADENDSLTLRIRDNNASETHKIALKHKSSEVKANQVYWSDDSKFLYILINDVIDHLFKYDIATKSLTNIPLGEEINTLAIESDNTIYCSSRGGAIFRLVFNEQNIVSKSIIFESKNNFIVESLRYNRSKNMLLFTSRSEDQTFGNIYIYDIHLKRISYLFSNASSPFWARDRQ